MKDDDHEVDTLSYKYELSTDGKNYIYTKFKM